MCCFISVIAGRAFNLVHFVIEIRIRYIFSGPPPSATRLENYLNIISIQGARSAQEKLVCCLNSAVHVGDMLRHMRAEAKQDAATSDGLNPRKDGSVMQKWSVGA